jgi:hypothetical protein
VGEAQQVVAAADLGHGENDKMLDDMMGNTSSIVEWTTIEGNFTPEVLANVSILIMGQPQFNLSSDEVEALQAWLAGGSRVVWIGGDSDYSGGVTRQAVANSILEALGSHLRLELAEVLDDSNNTGRPWSILVHVQPDEDPDLNTGMLSQNVTKPILAHGPTVLYWLNDNGTCSDLASSEIPGLVRIVWTYATAYIKDSQPPAPVCYSDGQQGPFVFMAAEIIGDDLIIVSGETPYGGYQPMWTPEYYGTDLDGPQFIENVIAWAAWWVESHSQTTTTTSTTSMTGTNTTTTTTSAATQTTTTTTATATSTTQAPPATSTTTSPAGTTTSTTTATTTTGTTGSTPPTSTATATTTSPASITSTLPETATTSHTTTHSSTTSTTTSATTPAGNTSTPQPASSTPASSSGKGHSTAVEAAVITIIIIVIAAAAYALARR